MNIKQLLGSQAHWTINKHFAKTIGIYPTILLQHLIDLDENFFKGIESGFYQQQDRMLIDLPMSESQLRNATSELVKLNFITATRKGIPPKYFYTINYVNLYGLINETFKGSKSEPMKVQKVNQKDKELSNNTNNKNNINIDDDFYGKIFFKIVEKYPANRIGNRQHGLKKFKTLSKEDAKLAAVNLKRYLKLSEGFHKSLQNYITEECWSEAWLKAEENKNNKENTKLDTKTFKGEY